MYVCMCNVLILPDNCLKILKSIVFTFKIVIKIGQAFGDVFLRTPASVGTNLLITDHFRPK